VQKQPLRLLPGIVWFGLFVAAYYFAYRYGLAFRSGHLDLMMANRSRLAPVKLLCLWQRVGWSMQRRLNGSDERRLYRLGSSLDCPIGELAVK
jgi:hypothetical protein